jgi:hypothetical protein
MQAGLSGQVPCHGEFVTHQISTLVSIYDALHCRAISIPVARNVG